MRNIILRIFACFILISMVISCGKDSGSSSSSDSKNAAHAIKVGLVVGQGGFGDKAYNDIQYKGIVLLRKLYNIETVYRIPVSNDVVTPLLQELVDEKCNVIFYSSTLTIDKVKDIVLKNPSIKFILIDNPVTLSPMPDNIASVTFKQNEGSYLAGALAAMMSRSGKTGLICGSNLEVIRDFIIGYKAGVNSVNKNSSVKVSFLDEYDKDQNPWLNPKGAKNLATEMYTKGNVDIIFGVAAGSNMGIFQAAKILNKRVIGVDCDQDYLEQGIILTSMMKNIDSGMVFMIGEIINNRFKNKNYRLGLKDGAVGLSPMNFTKQQFTRGELEKIEKIKADIISGKIIVPTVYKNE